MLRCKQSGCRWYLVYINSLSSAASHCHAIKGTNMSKTTSLGLAPSTTLFGRLMATIDRLLMTSAEIAIRNGDLPFFGL
jgi:hypothetical protein